MLTLLTLLACGKHAVDDSAAGVTYYGDIRPILDNNCARCHNDTGTASSFDDPAVAQGLAATMQAYTQSGYMPPPAPAADCRDYQSSDRYALSDADKALISDWADAGAPLGDVVESTRDTSIEQLDHYDIELWPSQPYSPSFVEDSGNDYRCFLIDLNNPAPTWITAMQAQVDNTRIVHHVVLFSPDGTDDLYEDGGDPHDGFSCSGLGQGNWGTIGAWAPGDNPTVLPEGIGIPLAASAQVVLQMHYFNSFEDANLETDQSGYGLQLTDSVEHEATNYAAGPTEFTIPAGDPAYEVRDTYRWQSPGSVLAVWPHMHLLGSTFEEVITHADGSEECLLRMDGWDFHNQITANLIEPALLADGDRLKITCTYDNSATNPNQVNDPPIDVVFGERTTDEMCFGFTVIAD